MTFQQFINSIIAFFTKHTENKGFVHKEKRPSDWVADVESGIVHKVHVFTGNWNEFAPQHQLQYFVTQRGHADTNACTCFSAARNLEAQGNRMLSSNEIPADKIQQLKKWGFIVSDRFSISARFIALVSKNDPSFGNTFVAVWDAIREHTDGSGFGLVPEKMCPRGESLREFYDRSILTPDLLSFAKNILTVFQINYEFLPSPFRCSADLDMAKTQLQQAPLQIASSFCPGWDEDYVVQKCHCLGQHATNIFNLHENFIDDFDSETDSNRRLALDYPITALLKPVMSLKGEIPPPPPEFVHFFANDLSYGMKNNAEVRLLQDKLKTIKKSDGVSYFPTNVVSTGNYRDITMKAVAQFQVDNGIYTPVPGRYCWLRTRTALNANN